MINNHNMDIEKKELFKILAKEYLFSRKRFLNAFPCGSPIRMVAREIAMQFLEDKERSCIRILDEKRNIVESVIEKTLIVRALIVITGCLDEEIEVTNDDAWEEIIFVNIDDNLDVRICDITRLKLLELLHEQRMRKKDINKLINESQCYDYFD